MKEENRTIRLSSGEVIYTQAVVIEMTQIPADFLQECEAEGLIQTQEVGGDRGYSARDVRRLARIQRLRQDLELDLPAVEVVLHLRQQVFRLLNELDQMEERMRQREQEMVKELQELRRRMALESRWE